MGSGQSQFAPLKLRSLALVPSSGALSRPSELHLWQLHCKTLPSAPGAPVTDLRTFRARAPRDQRKEGQETVTGQAGHRLLLVCPPPPPGAINAREPQCQRDRRCPESAYINIIPSGLCNSSQYRHHPLVGHQYSKGHCSAPTSCLLRVSTIRIMLSTLRQ